MACSASSSIADELAEELFEEVKTNNYTDADLLEDDRGTAAAQSARDEQEVEQLFREGSGGEDRLSFEGMAGISEIAGLIADGDLTMDELRAMWAETPKSGGAIDVSSFGALLARIDELFEPVDDEAATRYMVTPGTLISDLTRSSVRKAIRNGKWTLRLDDKGDDPQVKPALELPGGGENPLCVLGECGGNVCALNRLRPGCEGMRPEFIDFCARSIVERVDCSDGIIYSSLGCGNLYFDWEMLDRLVHVEGVRVKEAWLVEAFGMEFKESNAARSAFADWFSDAGVGVRAFHSVDLLTDWLRVLPSGEQAHVMMECDAEYIADDVVPQTVLRPGGLHVTLTQELDEWGGRTPVRQLYQKDLEGPQRVRLLESKVFVDDSWVDRKA